MSILSATQTAVILAIKKTQSLVDKTQLALALGRDVSSALDNPQKYFTSQSLSKHASDLMSLLDGIKIDIQRINEANNGISAILKLLNQAQTLISQAGPDLFSSTTKISLSNNDINAIVAANPGVVYSAATGSFYELFGSAVSWQTARASALSSSLVIPPGVAANAGVGGHLANITSQAEETFIESIFTGNYWLGGSDAANEGQWIWTDGPEAGQQFWQGNNLGSTVNGAYTDWWTPFQPDNFLGNENYLHFWSGPNAWNDLANTDPLGFAAPGYLIEWDSSLLSPTASYSVTKTAQYQTQYLEILRQIDKIAEDSHYLGINLLLNNQLTTFFNPDRSNFLTTQGTDATSNGLGLVDSNFSTQNLVEVMESQVSDAINFLRTYSKSLSIDFSVISMRSDFTPGSINIHKNAADGLVIADENEKGAEMLSLQVRQKLQFQVLAITKSNIADILF